MKTYIIQYRQDGPTAKLRPFGSLQARSPAGAIIQAAQALRDIEGDLEIVATEYRTFGLYGS